MMTASLNLEEAILKKTKQNKTYFTKVLFYSRASIEGKN
jgi:hypothetical protein